MSSTVHGYGFVGVLQTHLGRKRMETLREQLWDEDSILSVTSHGLVYVDYMRRKPPEKREDIYGLWFGPLQAEGGINDVIDMACKHGLVVDAESVRPYRCIWYNGVDFPLDIMTVEQFRKQTG